MRSAANPRRRARAAVQILVAPAAVAHAFAVKLHAR